MKELGKRKDLNIDDQLKPVTMFRIADIGTGRPTKMPVLDRGQVLVCVRNRSLDELVGICENLKDMQDCYDFYYKGGYTQISWYTMPAPSTPGGVLQALPDEGFSTSLITSILLNVPEEVIAAIVAYAMGNPGAARVLADRAVDFTSATQVEELVGWPLKEHRLERTVEIWQRFSS